MCQSKVLTCNLNLRLLSDTFLLFYQYSITTYTYQYTKDIFQRKPRIYSIFPYFKVTVCQIRNTEFLNIFKVSCDISMVFSINGLGSIQSYFILKLLSVKDNSGQMHLTAVCLNWNGLKFKCLKFWKEIFRFKCSKNDMLTSDN